eukprot:365875-Chlamydomonas_euryale.AAC.4
MDVGLLGAGACASPCFKSTARASPSLGAGTWASSLWPSGPLAAPEHRFHGSSVERAAPEHRFDGSSVEHAAPENRFNGSSVERAAPEHRFNGRSVRSSPNVVECYCITPVDVRSV